MLEASLGTPEEQVDSLLLATQGLQLAHAELLDIGVTDSAYHFEQTSEEAFYTFAPLDETLSANPNVPLSASPLTLA